MRKHFYLIVLLACGICISCVSEKMATSHLIPVKRLNNSQYFDDTLYFSNMQEIYLQDSKDCVINDISKIIYLDSLIYIFDRIQDQLVCFDYQGKYIGRVGERGRGNGEYVHLIDVTYDKYSNTFLLLVDPSSIMYYSKSGNFLKKEALDKYYTDIITDSSYVYLYYSTFANGVQPSHSIECINKSNGEKRQMLKFEYEYAPFCSLGNSLFECADSICMVRKFDKNLYCLKDGNINLAYNLDFGKQTFPNSKMNKRYNCDELYRICKDNCYIYGISKVVMGHKHILFSSNLLGLNVVNKERREYSNYNYMNITKYNIPASNYAQVEGDSNICCFILYPLSIQSLKKQWETNTYFRKTFNPAFIEKVRNHNIESSPILYLFKIK